jgi:hypothetical protein
MSVRARVAEARRQLMQIPGVVGVGYGYKQRAGVTTQELSLRVYVRAKRPRSSLADHELVPATVNGLATDVIELRPARLLACESTSAVSPLVGGITVTNLKTVTSSGVTGVGLGTLGCLCTLNDVGGRDRIGLLSNHHVLASGGAAVGDTVYNPQLTPAGGGNFSLDPANQNPVGELRDLGLMGQYSFTYPGAGEAQGSYFLDCASAKVSTNYSSWCHTNIGTTFDKRIRDLAVGGSDVVAGVARITEDDLQPGSDYVVVKVGRATGKTTGKVVDTQSPFALADPAVTGTGIILVENTGPNCGSPTVFADHGDSGSVVVNSDRKIIGLLFGGATDASPTTGFVSHIHPVLDKLRMTVLSAVNDPAAAGTSTLAELRAEAADGMAVARAAALRAEILASERGGMYRALVGKHLSELQHLINRVRPVTVAWHRLHGPDFAAHALHASRHADHDVPRALHGQARSAAFAALLEVLDRHGSAALRADLAEHAGQIRRLVDGADNLEALALALRSS